MTICAGHSYVGSHQRKLGLLVLSQCEGGRCKRFQTVAALAFVQQGSSSELSAVSVLVAVGAEREFDFEFGRLAGRDMTLGAFDLRMRTIERISAGGVVLHGKLCWLPAFHGVAGFTLVSAFAFCELAFMRIRLMAVRTERERDFGFEVATVVAFGAIHFGMQAQQREVGFGMVELRTESSCG